jgi:hypothetical protein
MFEAGATLLLCPCSWSGDLLRPAGLKIATKGSHWCWSEVMRHFGKWPARLLSGLALSLSATLLVTDAPGNPYLVIAGRNVFALQPPQPKGPAQQPAPLPKVMTVGITTILLDKRVLLRVCFPPRLPEPAKEVSCILAVGQREGPIEVLAIDETAGSVKINNSGTIMVLTLDRDSPRPQPSTMPTGLLPRPI